jgi:hypothetical protein
MDWALGSEAMKPDHESTAADLAKGS